ncbi:UDP-glucose 4-epimerase [Brevinema andersonii]|uniref:UDP-glucose 4-epimerase n=1 Tax=Brevinema andersonii TaxID=34097 RepID=A0A1I1DI97_BREAD|nr:UDP-glucose 4-epimerase GalE [Brevinema andersonii]SFB74156.1 UDP-glucose 4-epimerase [Brevinema andersonii]
MKDTILIVGGAGYIGSHIVKELHQQGYPVVVLDNLSKGHREAISAIDKNIPLIEGDLGDSTLLEKIFKEYPIKTVMHFAAFIEVGTSMMQPDVYYENNFCKVLSLLKAMIKANINYFVFSSTAATFGNPQAEKIDENHPQIPINPYGSSKLMVERLLKDMAYAYPDFHYCIFRYFNACGADHEGIIGQSYEPPTHLLSVMLKTAAGQRDSLSIFGNDYPTSDGTCVRDYIHVTDLAKAHILGMERMISQNVNDDFNLGNGSGFSVKEMVEVGKKVTGVDFKVLYTDRRAGDPALLIADPQKTKKILNWNPQFTLKDMVKTAWYWEQHKTY